MEDKKPTEDTSATPENIGVTQTAPADALEKTNEELTAEGVDATGSLEAAATEGSAKKVNPLKAFWHKVDVYLLGFILIMVVVAATSAVSFLNSKKAPDTPEVATQQLTTDALKQLANSDATVGNAAQTLTVQGNAVFTGQLLVQKDLDVAGRIRLGGDLQAATLTVAGKTNLADTQINSLQVAQNAIMQGTTTLSTVNVSGASNFSGPMGASQITVTRLIMSGNAVLQVPNHIAFTGAPAQRASINTGVLGNGGTASVNGSDTVGTVNINSGNNPTAGCFISVNFAQAFASPPNVIISPVGLAAGQTQYYVTRTNTGFSVCTANPAPANQVFGFSYFVAG